MTGSRTSQLLRSYKKTSRVKSRSRTRRRTVSRSKSRSCRRTVSRSKSRSTQSLSKSPLQCTHTVHGKQCKNNQAVNGTWFCNKHLDKIFNLKIKPSSIKGAGMGLFAGSYGFKKGAIVGEYSRYDIKKTMAKMYKHCHSHKCQAYIYCSNNDCWDAKNTPSIIVRHANDARSGKKNNASFDEYGRRVFMVADKNIKSGAEIFCDYGEDYDWSFLG